MRRLLREAVISILNQKLRLKDPEDEEDHDDELADFGWTFEGMVPSALVALSVAAHVAAVALLHRSARRLKNRERLQVAARVVTARLSRRGDAPLGRKLGAALDGLGMPKFDRLLEAATRTASRELRNVQVKQLEQLVGRAAAKELRGRTLFRAATLTPTDAEKVASLVCGDAELQVGLGNGAVLAPLIWSATPVLTIHAGTTEVRISQLKPR